MRLLRPVFDGARKLFRRTSNPLPKPAPTRQRKRDQYDDLTPYEVEDADYEDIRRDGS